MSTPNQSSQRTNLDSHFTMPQDLDVENTNPQQSPHDWATASVDFDTFVTSLSSDLDSTLAHATSIDHAMREFTRDQSFRISIYSSESKLAYFKAEVVKLYDCMSKYKKQVRIATVKLYALLSIRERHCLEAMFSGSRFKESALRERIDDLKYVFEMFEKVVERLDSTFWRAVDSCADTAKP